MKVLAGHRAQTQQDHQPPTHTKEGVVAASCGLATYWNHAGLFVSMRTLYPTVPPQERSRECLTMCFRNAKRDGTVSTTYS